MKSLILAALSLSLLVACSKAIEIVTDEETGCQYLYSYKGGYTPRLDRAGKPVCKGEYK